jgi:osmotically-inducible protein OsmY
MTELCDKVANALYWNLAIPLNRVTADVDRDVVTLRGIVTLVYQKSFAEQTVRHVCGVRSVNNKIAVCTSQGTFDHQVSTA